MQAEQESTVCACGHGYDQHRNAAGFFATADCECCQIMRKKPWRNQ